MDNKSMGNTQSISGRKPTETNSTSKTKACVVVSPRWIIEHIGQLLEVLLSMLTVMALVLKGGRWFHQKDRGFVQQLD